MKDYHLVDAEYDILLYLYKRPRKLSRIKKKFKPASDDQWNIWLSDLRPLYSVIPDGANELEADKLYLHDIGKTVARQESERRCSLEKTRKIAIASLVISIIAILLQAGALALQWLSLRLPQ